MFWTVALFENGVRLYTCTVFHSPLFPFLVVYFVTISMFMLRLCRFRYFAFFSLSPSSIQFPLTGRMDAMIHPSVPPSPPFFSVSVYLESL